MARQLNSWLKAYMEATTDSESSDAYHFWTGVTIIGAATKRHLYLPLGKFKIHPNHYVMLVGPSGARKSTALDLMKSIMEGAGVKIFSNKLTAAALIQQLSEANEKTVKGAEIEISSPLLIYSSELGVFLGSDAYSSGVISDLTDLYDNPTKWEKRTISRGAETILGPYVSLLAASTPQTLKDIIPMAAVGQGFTSRIIFVWAQGRRKRTPIPEWDEGHQMLERNLIHDLKEISKLSGIFRFDAGGLQLYKRHYLERPEPEEEYQDERLRGYSSRKDIHTLKLAMSLSLANNDSLVITESEMAGAIEAIGWLDEGLPAVFSGHGGSATSADIVRIFQEISVDTRKSGFSTQAAIVRRNYHMLNSNEIGLVLQTLIEGGAIGECVLTDNSGKLVKAYKTIDESFLHRTVSQFPKSLIKLREE